MPVTKRKRMGRPKLALTAKRNVRMTVILTTPEWAWFEAEAKRLGTTTVELARKRVLEGITPVRDL